MSKRETGLDLIRCTALLLVVVFHSFLYNGYYYEPQTGIVMWLWGSFRWLSVSGIGLFLMLTGYLKSDRTDLRDCYRSLIPIFLGYCLAAAISIPVRHFAFGEVHSLHYWLRAFVGFYGVYYGWYVEMYVGLTLLSPFLNRMLKTIPSTELWKLIVVMLILTALPVATPLGICPDYWRSCYPLTYYILGAMIRRMKPSVNPYLCILSALGVAAILGAGTVLSTEGPLGEALTWEFPDIWIFSQMFYSMKRTGLPLTTLERDGLLSHFAVHFSPIYYLMLPFFWIFPHPATLQVLQAVLVVSGAIPLWLLGRQKGLSGVQRILLCYVLLLYPAYSGGVSYDLHENCFLTPLLLWLFYGVERKNWWITGISCLLTLMVKEDAAVYTAVFGLYLLLHSALRTKSKWNLAAGCLMLVLSLGRFAAVTGYLAGQGDGVMTYRYSNFIYDGSGSLLTVIKSVVLNPMKAVYECVDPEKQLF